jgi:hypothetical protein
VRCHQDVPHQIRLLYFRPAMAISAETYVPHDTSHRSLVDILYPCLSNMESILDSDDSIHPAMGNESLPRLGVLDTADRLNQWAPSVSREPPFDGVDDDDDDVVHDSMQPISLSERFAASTESIGTTQSTAMSK